MADIKNEIPDQEYAYGFNDGDVSVFKTPKGINEESLGFSMIFRLRRSLWMAGSLGGALCWGCYLLMFDVTQHIFASGLVASAFAAVYAEIFARKKMAPTLLFVIPSVVPLIPGSSLYYTMSAAVSGNTREISEYGSLTLQYALSIAAGISIVWTFCSIWRRYQTMNYIKKHSD